MKTSLKVLFIAFSMLCLLGQQKNVFSLQNSLEMHFSNYSKFNTGHHDNIDDEVHSHRHKHSEDGTEHEHHHDHSKHLQSDIKIISNSSAISTNYQLIESKNGFYEKSLSSNAHPFAIFRPPIA
ncbi:MAG: hypothetical protein CME71_06875 [Halobacteriovorax sp.]|nr:hypothetical protein [Halobacteriovorax sp.]